MCCKPNEKSHLSLGFMPVDGPRGLHRISSPLLAPGAIFAPFPAAAGKPLDCPQNGDGNGDGAHRHIDFDMPFGMLAP